MQRMSFPEFVAARDEFDALVLRSGERAGSCWLSPWQFAGRAAMHGRDPDGRSHLIYRSEDAWGAWIESSQAGVFVPFEPVWMFGSPLAGDPAAAVRLALEVQRRHADEVLALVVGGIAVGSALHRALQLVATQAPGLRYGEAAGTESCLIELLDEQDKDPYDAWLARRSANFRRAARRARLARGVAVEDASSSDPAQSFARIVSLQERSYKAAQQGDIFAIPEYREFYSALLTDLRESDCLRLSFAVRGGQDLAYYFGFSRAHHYRGFQMGYAEEARSLGLGTYLHLAHLRKAASEGVTRFDLGMHAPYKERWCDRVERTVITFLQ
ncbi:MAG: GNAT family N-acetyltransferase [Planctomycetota bacterium]